MTGARTTTRGEAEAAPAPEVMRALRVHAFGKPPRLEEVPAPEPGPKDVLVRLTASVVSHHDLTVAGGEFPLRPQLPYTPGLEGAGRVVAVGSEAAATGLGVGTRVRVFAGGLGATRPGTWGEVVAVTPRAVTPIPEGLSDALAAAAGSVALTAWAAAIDVGGLQAGERIGVTGGSGAVGSLVAQLAASHGAAGIVAWLRSPERRELLPAEAETPGPGDEVEPVDLLVDTVGGPLLPKRLRAVKPGGRAVLVGYTAGTEVTFSLPDLLVGDVVLLPLNMMRKRLPEGLEARLVGDVAAGRLRVAVETVGLDELRAAIARLERGEVAGRVVLEW